VHKVNLDGSYAGVIATTGGMIRRSDRLDPVPLSPRSVVRIAENEIYTRLIHDRG
jgi:hypothetical protein